MKVTDKIHLLKIDFEIVLSPEKKVPRFVNIVIVFGEKITLIDSGVKGSEKIIFDYIKKNHRDFSEISQIFLSHSHPDHIGSAQKIKELTNCKVLAHKAEQNWIENIELQNKERPVPGFFKLVDQPVKIDAFLDHRQTLTLDKDITVEIIHAPGHSKGSLNFKFMQNNILFSADSIPLKGDIPNYDNYFDLYSSLENIKNENYDILLTSWTPILKTKSEIEKIIIEGENYLKILDYIVKESYIGEEPEPLVFCKSAITKMKLPPFLVHPIVDKAFRSHF